MLRIAVLVVIVLATLLVVVPRTATATGDSAPSVRVGTYDSRAIAVAYAASEHNVVSEKMKAFREAKEAGDKKRVKELEAWGRAHQRQLHRQGFGRVPVTDLLEPVEDRFPEVARDAGVSVIAFECNYLGSDVEEVDVTMRLVELYQPSEKTLKSIKELLEHDPVDLDDLEHDD